MLYSLVVAVCLAFVPASTLAGHASGFHNKVTEPQPMTGFVHFSQLQRDHGYNMHFLYANFWEICSGPGQYDWTTLDTMLTNIYNSGMNSIVRLSLSVPFQPGDPVAFTNDDVLTFSEEDKVGFETGYAAQCKALKEIYDIDCTHNVTKSSVPKWIRESAGYKVKRTRLGYYNVTIPDWTSQILQDEYKKFMVAYTEHYAIGTEHHHKIFLTQGFFGSWAEGHYYPYRVDQLVPAGRFPTPTYVQEYLELAQASFEKSDMLWSMGIVAAGQDSATDAWTSPVVLTDQFKAAKFGTYDDTFMTFATTEYRNNLHNILEDSTRRYKDSPIGGEIGYDSTTMIVNDSQEVIPVRAMALLPKEGIVHDINYNGQNDFKTQVKDRHMSYMFCSGISSVSEYYTSAYMMNQASALGYKFEIQNITVNHESGYTNYTVQNIGVAPIYKDAFMTVGSVRSKGSLKLIQPGEIRVLTVNASLLYYDDIKIETEWHVEKKIDFDIDLDLNFLFWKEDEHFDFLVSKIIRRPTYTRVTVANIGTNQIPADKPVYLTMNGIKGPALNVLAPAVYPALAASLEFQIPVPNSQTGDQVTFMSDEKSLHIDFKNSCLNPIPIVEVEESQKTIYHLEILSYVRGVEAVSGNHYTIVNIQNVGGPIDVDAFVSLNGAIEGTSLRSLVPTGVAGYYIGVQSKPGDIARIVTLDEVGYVAAPALSRSVKFDVISAEGPALPLQTCFQDVQSGDEVSGYVSISEPEIFKSCDSSSYLGSRNICIRYNEQPNCYTHDTSNVLADKRTFGCLECGAPFIKYSNGMCGSPGLTEDPTLPPVEENPPSLPMSTGIRLCTGINESGSCSYSNRDIRAVLTQNVLSLRVCKGTITIEGVVYYTSSACHSYNLHTKAIDNKGLMVNYEELPVRTSSFRLCDHRNLKGVCMEQEGNYFTEQSLSQTYNDKFESVKICHGKIDIYQNFYFGGDWAQYDSPVGCKTFNFDNLRTRVSSYIFTGSKTESINQCLALNPCELEESPCEAGENGVALCCAAKGLMSHHKTGNDGGDGDSDSNNNNSNYTAIIVGCTIAGLATVVIGGVFVGAKRYYSTHSKLDETIAMDQLPLYT